MSRTLNDPKPNYVFFCPWCVKPGAGVNNVILGLSEALSDTYKVQIAVVGWDAPNSAEQVWLKLRSPGPWLSDSSGSLKHLKRWISFCVHLIPTLWRLSQLLPRGAIANAHFIGPEYLTLAILRRLRLCRRLILSAHGADVRELALAAGLSKRVCSWMLNSADVVIACSRSLAKDVQELAPSAKVGAVWNAAPARPIVSQHRPVAWRYLISVAAFVSKKGHDVLVRAFQAITNNFADLRLVLIGADGPERLKTVDLVADLGLRDRVHFMTDVPQGEVWRWVQFAECLVLASRDEPFGIVLLEAAMLHTPVVATRVGGIVEFVRDNEDAILCAPNNPSELARAMLQVLSNKPAARSRSAAFFEHASSFTWAAAAKQYCELARLGEATRWDSEETRPAYEPESES